MSHENGEWKVTKQKARKKKATARKMKKRTSIENDILPATQENLNMWERAALFRPVPRTKDFARALGDHMNISDLGRALVCHGVEKNRSVVWEFAVTSDGATAAREEGYIYEEFPLDNGYGDVLVMRHKTSEN